MKPWCVLALGWAAACGDGDPAPLDALDAGSGSGSGGSGSGASSGGSSSGNAAGASSGDPGAAVTLHAAYDLPRTVRTHTLSALTGDGTNFFALPDKDPRIVTLVPNADCTEFTPGEGAPLSGLPRPEWDGEGLARAQDGSFYVVTAETTPHVAHVTAAGAFLADVPMPARYGEQPRNNKGLESLTLSPGDRYLFTTNESALLPDGPAPTKTAGTAVRFLRLALTDATSAQFAYRTEPLGAGSGGDMGVSDLLALDEETLLVLERGYQSDYGNTVRVFRVSLKGAADVSAQSTLGEAPRVLEKELLVDVGTLAPGDVQHPSRQPNPLLDNYEGLTLGPTLPDGRRLLLLLSDDNGQASQVARVLVLAVRGL